MPWPCYMVELVREDITFVRDGVSHHYVAGYRLSPGAALVPFPDLRVGAVWMDDREGYGLGIKLPGYSVGVIWYPWQPPTNKLPMGVWKVDGWKVEGEAPRLTTTPSINFIGAYHGWLRDGVVTDDCEGRKFNDLGRLL